ncbi:hypothetical protein RHMOL_Rhmol09G0075100 [Rhododendron molle]|uniref:Uncharacterized protein n=1 Tax=Rhododendron molle TaxID=49168 RepID=A0ACC0MCR5_RHOML|nr:hypothetical protein RHMOL_Rhmol09G0075100 [Rhododendron molle]
MISVLLPSAISRVPFWDLVGRPFNGRHPKHRPHSVIRSLSRLRSHGHTMDLNLNELHSPDPRTTDGLIQRLQQQHRSREVWEADHTRPVDSKKVRVHSAKKGIRALPWPSPPVLELIRRAHLEGLCSLSFVSLDWGIITTLLERWRPETHTFHFRPGESTITLQDVEVLLDISVEGEPVSGNTNLKPYELCKRLLGEQPTEESEYINGMKVKASWLSDRFTGQVKEGADPEVCAWERLPYLALGRLGKHALKAGAPLIGRWDDVLHSPDLATHFVGAYRLNLVVPLGDINLVEYPFDDPYVASYDKITKRCISCVGCGVDGVTRYLKALNMLGVPAPYRDVALAALMHMGMFEKFLRLEPPQHGVFKGNEEGLVKAKRRRIDESSLGDVKGSVGDGDITQVGLDTQDLHVDPQHEAEVELDFVPNNDGQDDEVEEEADFQDSIVGGDIEGGGEATQSTTKIPVVAQHKSKRQRKKLRCDTGDTLCKDEGGKTKRACH